MLSIEDSLNSSQLVFPVLECFHIVGFAFSVGTVALVNFRLLNLGVTSRSAADLWRGTWIWTILGLILMFSSGLMLFSTDPDNYYLNYAFLVKMVFLLLAIIYNYTMVRRTAMSSPPEGNRTVALTALGLWAAVLFGGIAIGFFTFDIPNI